MRDTVRRAARIAGHPQGFARPVSGYPDTPIISDTGEDASDGGERRDVLDAMAVYSADGQADLALRLPGRPGAS